MRSIIFIMMCIMPVAVVSAGPLDLSVVYPKPEQNLPAVDSTFIFGSVDPGAILTVNGYPVDVHEEGGWLAFVPTRPGDFEFFVRAAKEDIKDTLTIPVHVPPPPDNSCDSLYFRTGSLIPALPLWVKPGDDIVVSFEGTPYCNAFCLVSNTGDTIAMREMPPRNYYSGPSIFRGEDEAPGSVPDSLMIRGIYEGVLTVPDQEADSLTLVFYLYPPSAQQIIWMMTYVFDSRGPLLPFHKLASLPPLKAETLAVPIQIIPDDSKPMIELTDSLTVIRTGPRKGYLCIHQPAGIRAEVIGREGNWLKLKLSENQVGWVPDSAVVFLPEGTTVPHSYIRQVQTINHEDRISVIIGTSAKHPFRIIEDIRERTLTAFLYGADSDTDWIRYDNSDSLIDHIVWFQPEPGLFGIRVHLADDRIWGYDGRYIGNELYLDIKKSPPRAQEISDLRIVIDPGHSPDPGAVGPTGLAEKDANLAIALCLRDDLEKEGGEVIITRADDSPLGLYDRPKIAVREKADIFISIHNNALSDGTNPFVNNGVSTYYYHPHSAELARAVQNSMACSLGLDDFDWYHANFAVNRPTQYPAILVESAFMMIPEQEALLKTEKFRRKISRAIVDGIKDFLRGGPLEEWDFQQIESYGWE